MRKLLSFSALFCIASSCVPAVAGSDTKPAQDKTCGPPNYCARTDRRVEPYPATPLAVGPAGSVVTDPTFGSRILRVTDARTDPRRPGGSLMTPSSAEQNSWNKTNTKFYVTTTGGQFLLYDFDPSKMTARLSGMSSAAFGGEPQFSYTQPDILYGMGSRSAVFQQLDVSTGRLKDLHNASDCVKLNGSDFGRDITVSADDNRMVASLGPQQNANYLVYVYDREQGCRWYNTSTGEVGGKWGPKGTVSTPDRTLIHNVRMSKSGKFVYIVRSNSSPQHHWLVWEIDTVNVAVCTTKCSGHHAVGYSHILGPTGQNHPLELQVRPLNHLEASSPILTGLPRSNGYWYDQHFSWNNANENDTNPACFSTYRPSNPNTPGTPLATDGPWENEVDCVETDGKDSKVWRFAHTFSTAKNGFWSTPRGNISLDGRFFMFTSDWQDQLGRAPNDRGYRTDVFIVELK